MAKKKVEIPDGPTPKLMQQYSSAVRRVWQWSKMRRLAIKRATRDDGFPYCELCHKMLARCYVDHIIPCGPVNSEGFFDRLNIPSKGLQVLCAKCHNAKTKKEKKKA